MDGRFRVTALAAMLLFAVFAACVSLVLVTGAGVYRGVVGRDQAAVAAQAARQYLIMKAHGLDDAGTEMQVMDLDGTPRQDGPALSFLEDDGESAYRTVIYCLDGYVRELFTDAGTAFDPGMGEIVMAADGLAFRLTGHGFVADVTTDGNTARIYVAMRTEGGGGT